jgi:hypothetical protein
MIFTLSLYATAMLPKSGATAPDGETIRFGVYHGFLAIPRQRPISAPTHWQNRDNASHERRMTPMLSRLLARFGFGPKEVVDERFESRMMSMGRRSAQALPGAGRSAFRFQH